MNSRVLPMLLVVAALPALAAPAPKQSGGSDRIYMKETVISGNQELPKVLYILPWRDDPGKALAASAPAFDPGQVMQPIYPDEYRRALKYRALAQPKSSTH